MYTTASDIAAAALVFLVGLVIGGAAQPTLSDAVDAGHLQGRVLFGYQGFFRRPGQGNDHWMIKYGEIPGPSTPGDGELNLNLVPTYVNLQILSEALTLGSPIRYVSQLWSSIHKSASSPPILFFPTAPKPSCSNPTVPAL